MSEEDRKWLEQLIRENKELKLDRKHLLDLQKSMDKQYEELEQENQQLKDEIKLYKDSDMSKSKMLIDRESSISTLYKEKQKYKSVLDEIRDTIKPLIPMYGKEIIVDVRKLEDLLQILDKVGKE